MSYVDAVYDKSTDQVLVVERNNGTRVFKNYPALYQFYYDDPKGKFRTIYDTPVSKVVCRTNKEFQKEKRVYNDRTLWESDIDPVSHCLEKEYLHKPMPILHTAFIDIESGFDYERGFAPTEDPFNSITAATVYLDWLDRLVTVAVPPKCLTIEEAQELIEDIEDTFLVEDDAQLLNAILDLIEDADIISGWNSSGYDLPYIVNRTVKILSKDDTRRLCLWGQYPKPREFNKFGKIVNTYDLIGRIHLDYMELYQKFTLEERHSYSLDSISEYELQEHKTPYNGTLDQLYNRDFRKFIEYNRQDVGLLGRLDKKLRFIDLANTIAHSVGVLIPAAKGTVAITDHGIINQAHAMGLVVHDRKKPRSEAEIEEADENDGKIPGGYVADPRTGLHEWIGGVDINSLYPSVFRCLNMSPETLIGQIRCPKTEQMIQERINAKHSFSEAWEGEFGCLEYTAVVNRDAAMMLTVDWENGSSTELSAAELWEIIWAENRPWVLTANGTIFTVEKQGLIPQVLAAWYADRKVQQGKKKMADEMISGIKLPERFLV